MIEIGDPWAALRAEALRVRTRMARRTGRGHRRGRREAAHGHGNGRRDRDRSRPRLPGNAAAAHRPRWPWPPLEPYAASSDDRRRPAGRFSPGPTAATAGARRAAICSRFPPNSGSDACVTDPDVSQDAHHIGGQMDPCAGGLEPLRLFEYRHGISRGLDGVTLTACRIPRCTGGHRPADDQSAAALRVASRTARLGPPRRDAPPQSARAGASAPARPRRASRASTAENSAAEPQSTKPTE